MKKIISIVLTLIVVVTMFLSTTSVAAPSVGNISANGGNFTNLAGTLIGYIQWVGYAISVGMLIYVGIKYVTSSAEAKADLKNGMIRYVVGAVLIAGASAIAGWVFDAGRTAVGEGTAYQIINSGWLSV